MGDLGEDMGRGNIGDEEVGGHAEKGMGCGKMYRESGERWKDILVKTREHKI